VNKFKVIDFYRGTQIVPKFEFYRQCFSKSPGMLLDIQRGNLINFLISLSTNSFYKIYMKDFNRHDIQNWPYQILRELPIHTKDDITKNFELLKNSNFSFEHAYTGGSTGMPFHYLSDKKSVSALRSCNYAFWNHFLAYNLGNDVIVIAGTSLGGNVSFKKKTYNYLQSKTFFSGGYIQKDEVLRFVSKVNKSFPGVYIYAYPSSLLEYIHIIEHNKWEINYTNVKGVITTSEMLFDDVKANISRFFHTKVLNMYGATDGGIISGSIDNQFFWYNGLDCVIETKMIDGQSELLLTNLNSFAFPFVRYRVGDLALTKDSPKGYPFQITNLCGRTRDFVFLKGDRKFHGVVFNNVFKKFPNVSSYQIEQFEDLSCEVSIILKSGDASAIVEKITYELSTLFSNIPFKVKIVGEMKKMNNSKHKVIISHVS
jgi:phenylacetate-CoA ligase